MAFSKPKLKSNLENTLIKQEKVRPEEAILLRNIIEGFKRGIV